LRFENKTHQDSKFSPAANFGFALIEAVCYLNYSAAGDLSTLFNR